MADAKSAKSAPTLTQQTTLQIAQAPAAASKPGTADTIKGNVRSAIETGKEKIRREIQEEDENNPQTPSTSQETQTQQPAEQRAPKVKRQVQPTLDDGATELLGTNPTPSLPTPGVEPGVGTATGTTGSTVATTAATTTGTVAGVSTTTLAASAAAIGGVAAAAGGGGGGGGGTNGGAGVDPTGNRAPAAIGSQFVIGENDVVREKLTARDLDGDSLTFTLGDNAPEGLILDASSGIIEYRAPVALRNALIKNDFSTVSFTYRVSDGKSSSGAATVEIVVVGAETTRLTDGDDVSNNTVAVDPLSIHGLDGNDQMIGGSGSDLLNGGNGNDRLDGGNGLSSQDTLTGGAGSDVFELRPRDVVTTNGAGDLIPVFTRITDFITRQDVLVADIAGTRDNYAEINGRNILDLLNGETTEEEFDMADMNIGEDVRFVLIYDLGGSGDGLLLTLDSLQEPDGLVLLSGLSSASSFDFSDIVARSVPSEAGDQLTGTAANDSISALGGSDTINTGDGNDVVFGDAGHDVVNLGNGDDTLAFDLSPGSQDSANGQAGLDTLTFTNGASGAGATFGNVVVNLGSPADQIIAIDNSAETRVQSGFENIDATGFNGGTRLNARGSDGNNVLLGGQGSDTLIGNGGDDTLIGGAGFNSISGGDGNDLIEIFVGNNPSDVADAGAGSDTLVLNGLTLDVVAFDFGVANGQDQLLSVGFTLDGDLQANFENLDARRLTGFGVDVSRGADAAQRLVGSEQSDTLAGGGGADTLEGGRGADVLLGGDGDDVLRVGSDLNEASPVKDFTPDVVLDGGAGSDTLVVSSTRFFTPANLRNIENIVIDNSRGFIVDVDVSFDMLKGPDKISRVTALKPSEFNTEDNSFLGVTGSNAAEVMDFSTGLTLINALLFVNSGAGADTVVGTSGNDEVFIALNAADIDVADGAAGSDLLFLANEDPGGVVQIDLSRTDGADQILSIAGVAENRIQKNFEYMSAESLLGSNGVDVIGSSEGNLLIGSAQADTINARAGADTIEGFGGLDFINGEDGNDIIEGNGTLIGGAGDDRIEGGGLLVAGAGNDSLTGSAGNDTLIGESGDDVIDGGTGFDSMTGGDGNDRITIEFNGNVVDFANGENGNDTLILSGTASGTVRINLAVTAGNDQITEVGGTAENTRQCHFENIDGSRMNQALEIVGSTAANRLSGGNGNDTIDAGTGSDTLTGGQGDDVLIGGAGADGFVFTAPDGDFVAGGSDTVVDFDSSSDSLLFNAREVSIATGERFRTGRVSSDNIVFNTTGQAEDLDDYFIYQTETGELFFDADGLLAEQSAVRVATLLELPGSTRPPELSTADFILI